MTRRPRPTRQTAPLTGPTPGARGNFATDPAGNAGRI